MDYNEKFLNVVPKTQEANIKELIVSDPRMAEKFLENQQDYPEYSYTGFQNSMFHIVCGGQEVYSQDQLPSFPYGITRSPHIKKADVMRRNSQVPPGQLALSEAYNLLDQYPLDLKKIEDGKKQIVELETNTDLKWEGVPDVQIANYDQLSLQRNIEKQNNKETAERLKTIETRLMMELGTKYRSYRPERVKATFMSIRPGDKSVEQGYFPDNNWAIFAQKCREVLGHESVPEIQIAMLNRDVTLLNHKKEELFKANPVSEELDILTAQMTIMNAVIRRLQESRKVWDNAVRTSPIIEKPKEGLINNIKRIVRR